MCASASQRHHHHPTCIIARRARGLLYLVIVCRCKIELKEGGAAPVQSILLAVSKVHARSLQKKLCIFSSIMIAVYDESLIVTAIWMWNLVSCSTHIAKRTRRIILQDLVGNPAMEIGPWDIFSHDLVIRQEHLETRWCCKILIIQQRKQHNFR